MKINFIRLITLIFYICSLISCSDKSKDFDLADFYVEISAGNMFYAQDGDIELKIKSEINNGKTTIRAVYVDDKGSSLTTANGTTIHPGDSFTIEGDFEDSWEYKFNSHILGEHNLEFIFFNSANYGRKYSITVMVGGDFQFTNEVLSMAVTVDEIVSIGYKISIEDSEPPQFPYKLKFDIEDQTQNSTLNGNNKNAWFDVTDLSGILRYIPKTPGIHQITIIAKNKYNIEKTTTLRIESK